MLNDTVTDRTRIVLLRAFMKIMAVKSYEEITVQEIARCANVGRSTFYRYFPGKVDLLLYFHEYAFHYSGIVPQDKDAWLADEPSPKLTHFLNRAKNEYHYTPFLYKLGNEIDYFTRQQKQTLNRMFRESLEVNFSVDELKMPYDLIAQGMSGIFLEIFLGWIEDMQSQAPPEMANYLHQLIRGVLLQGME